MLSMLKLTTLSALSLFAMIAITIVAVSGVTAATGQTVDAPVASSDAPHSFAFDARQDPAAEYMLAPVPGEATTRFANIETATLATPTSSNGVGAVTADDGTLRFDVAEDANRFAFADQPVHEDGLPAYGNAFVTQGYIYPEGTLNGANGVLADGSPEFPELVLGEWTCRGWFVGDGAHTTTGTWVITTQVYSFDDTMLVSEGYELADIDVAGDRAITGGTGAYASASGEGEQTLLGFNTTEGANLRYVLAPVVP